MFINPLGKTKYIEINVNRDEMNRLTESPGQRVCPSCSANVAAPEALSEYRVCSHCRHHFPLSPIERIRLLADEGSFAEFDNGLASRNILDFPDYENKLNHAQGQTGSREAIITGYAAVNGFRLVLGVMESRFMMASMGATVGEKVCRAAEKAMAERCPLLIVAASGGARMQEGMVSLMQMAKTSAVMERFQRSGLLFISLLTNPTTGGVLASFASLADIIIAEPGALIGFAGPRVIKQTIKHQLPDNFQRAEFLLEHGMLDMVVDRAQLKDTLTSILRIHQGGQHEKTV